MNFAAPAPDTKASILNEVTSVPQLLYQNEAGHLSAHISGPVASNRGKVLQGMAIVNKEQPGVIAYAHVPPPENTPGAEASPEQRLVCTIHGNNVRPSSRQFTFSAKPSELGDDREPHLFMRVEELGTSGVLHDSAGNANLIPLIPAPGSIAVAEPLSNFELQRFSSNAVSDLDLGNLLRGVIKSVPILADAGLQIYEQVSGGSSVVASQRGRYQDDQNVTFLPALGAIANVALPFVGSLIKGIAG